VRLGVLVSGRGSNLEAVLRAEAEGGLAGIEPALVVSNRPAVAALDVAARFGIPALVLRRADFATAAERDGAIGLALTEAGCDLALLAGYDQLLRPPYFAAFGGLTINIHPSLLPLHGGRGMTGLETHRAVLAAGDAETGVTIHLVTPDLDAGPLLVQERLPVRPGEPAEELAQRVLMVEHRLLVSTLGRLAAEGLPQGASASMTAASRTDGTQQHR
jgi:formyltetrahydrofolate-dependent phosphoribosylglycinamide formyltransferase